MQPLQQPKKIRFALIFNRKNKLNADGEALIQIRASLESYPLFRKTNQAVNRDLKELARLAGIKKPLTFHCARRTFCTFLATKVDPVTLQRLMGHSKMETTQLYIRLSNTRIQEELGKIDWS